MYFAPLFTRLFIIGTLLLIPSTFVYGALNAGVIDGIWFSKPEIEAGVPISVYTAVQNYSDTSAIRGTVTFLVDDNVAGSSDFYAPQQSLTPVSISYTFTPGEHLVSAYITTSEEGSVRYTIVPKRKIVATGNKLEDQKNPLTQTEEEPLTPSLVTERVKDFVSTLDTNTASESVSGFVSGGGEILKKVTPITEPLALKVEKFRDTTLSSNESSSEEDSEMLVSTSTQSFAQSSSMQYFFDVSAQILKLDELSMWKKVIGVALSGLALLIRWWWIFIVLLVLLFGWRMVRGQRLR